MTLATSGSEGLWTAGLFYVNRGFTFWFLSAPTTRHCRNISSSPAVAGAIHEDYEEWRSIKGIQFEGRARLVEGRERHEAVARYREKFPFVGTGAPRAIAEALGKVSWYEIVTERVYFVDNSLGFGHREEIPLD